MADDTTPEPDTYDDDVRSVELEDEDGNPYRVDQSTAAGRDNIAGGGEFPDPDAPSSAPAPGSAGTDVDT